MTYEGYLTTKINGCQTNMPAHISLVQMHTQSKCYTEILTAKLKCLYNSFAGNQVFNIIIKGTILLQSTWHGIGVLVLDYSVTENTPCDKFILPLVLHY